MKVLTPEAMRAVDRAAMEEFGLPGPVLMENAAIGVVDALGERFPEARSVAIFCGPGNNGGDGLAAGRHLAIRGYRVVLFLLPGAGARGDAAAQLALCRNQGLEIRELGGGVDLAAALRAARDHDLVVDALFGTGLSRPLEGLAADLVRGLNGLPLPRLAVDVPSGLDGGRPEPIGVHLEADLTVTFAAPKIAHALPPAADAAGEVVVADLGIPPELVTRAPGDLELLDAAELATWLMPRPAAAHKGDFGHVLLVAGSPGRAGAAILAARAAVRGGAGLVTVAVPRSILDVVDGGSLESMTDPLDEAASGLDPAAAAAVLAAAEGKSVVAIGPGLGLAEGTVSAVREVVGAAAVPLVADADAINAFAGAASGFAGRPAPTVLTPHPGELARLLGVATAEIVDDRLEAVRRAAAESAAVVVLKGHRTLIAEPGGAVWINPTGNPGMATGGSGDVLTGLLAALVAQGYAPAAAACLAVFVHGLAGDLAVATRGQTALRAGDLVEELPRAFDRLGRA